ncbi:MAG: hypothetical protein OEU86_10170 [Gammaproteobacteria bacterium]|nr:hypothetical protein [Gammaproteobacteria bacterium]
MKVLISRSIRLGAVFVTGALVMTVLAGCASFNESPDYERHRFSRISEPYDRKGVIYFDASFTARYPDNDLDAESLRMEWLEGWLNQRKLCVYGYNIDKRRPFGEFENNPARYDIRYEVSCKPRSQDAD